MKNKKIEEDENIIEEMEETQETIEELAQEPASAEATDEARPASAEATDEAKEKDEERLVESEEEKSADVKALADTYLSGWKRCQADFENYKKRQAEAQKDLLRYSTQSIVLQILPVIDNFQASTAHIPEDQKANPWVTGIMYIQKQLEQVLADNGVDECEVKVGDTFDPAKHEAIENKECACEAVKEKKFRNKIKQVVTRGYKIGDKVIRPARVVVE